MYLTRQSFEPLGMYLDVRSALVSALINPILRLERSNL
jgi:hypothetical protein